MSKIAQFWISESLEKTIENRKQAELTLKKEEQLKQDFYNLPEIENIIPNLKKLIPSKSDIILNRILLKYEKDPKNFNLNESLKKVLLGENISGIQSSWILIEHEDWTNYSKKEKEELYNKIISKTDNTNKVEKIPKPTEQAVNETIWKVKDILKKTKNPENQNKWWVENQENNNQENNNQKNNEKFDKINQENNIENPEESIINRLIKSDKLSPDTKEILEINKDTWWEINNQLLEWITDKDDKNLIENTLKSIPKNREDIKTDNLFNFKQDFPKLSDIAINWVNAKSIEKWKEPKSEEIIAYELISENYIKIWDNKNENNKLENLNTAIETASANLLKDNHTINKETEEFKQAIINIHWNNKEQKLEWLTKLVELNEKWKTKNWAIWSKLDKNSKKIGNKEKWNRKKLQERQKELQAEYKTLNKNPEQNKDKINKIIEEAKKIDKLLKKPKSWEVIISWKFDKNPEIPKIKENS